MFNQVKKHMNWAVELSRVHHPSQGMANLFGVLVFTDRHAHVKKMLRDTDYWAALDEMSGPKWVVFASVAQQGYREAQGPPPGMLGMMQVVWKEPKENLELLREFEIQSTEHLPALVVFAEANDGTLRKKVMTFDASSEQAALGELRKLMEAISTGLARMYPEYLQHETRAFDAVVDHSIAPIEQWIRIKKGCELLKMLKALII